MRRNAIANKENQVVFDHLQEEKGVIKIELWNIEVAYSILKDQMQGLTLKPSSQEKTLSLLQPGGSSKGGAPSS
jgi:hypothetical protein